MTFASGVFLKETETGVRSFLSISISCSLRCRSRSRGFARAPEISFHFFGSGNLLGSLSSKGIADSSTLFNASINPSSCRP